MQNEQSHGRRLDLRTLNEIKKLQLSAEFGTDLNSISVLPAFIESKWLSHIESMERACSTANRTSIWSHLGYPAYPCADKISDEQIQLELDKAIGRLLDAGINVRTLFKVPKRELYRFLTEDLMREEIDDLAMPGIERQYIYEDFHPNEEFDLEQTIIEFFDMLFGRYYPMLESIFYVEDGGELSESPERSKKVDHIIAFADAFDELSLEKWQMEDLQVEDDMATIAGFVSILGKPNRHGESLIFEGTAEFKLRMDHYGYWAIDELSVPGI